MKHIPPVQNPGDRFCGTPVSTSTSDDKHPNQNGPGDLSSLYIDV